MQLRAPITDTGNLEQRETPACSCVQRPPLNPGNRDPVSTSTSSGPTSTRPRQRPSEHLYPISAPSNNSVQCPSRHQNPSTFRSPSVAATSLPMTYCSVSSSRRFQ